MLHARVTATTLSCVGANIANDLLVQGQQPPASAHSVLHHCSRLPTPHPLPTSHAATSPRSHSTAVSTEGYPSPRKQRQTVCTHSVGQFLLEKTLTLSCPTPTEMAVTADRSRQGWGHVARGPMRPVTACGWPRQGNHSKFNQSTAGWLLG